MSAGVCIVTGGTSGIGEAASLRLGARGWRVLLLGRNRKRGEAVVHRIRKARGSGGAEFLPLDLGDPDAIREVAAKIALEHSTVNILINNAGARYDSFRAAPSGVEATFAANHLGHFLLTALLLERLLAAPDARIVTVTSGSLAPPPSDGRWALERDEYDRRRAYALSKSANLLFAVELARRLRGLPQIRSYAYDPGGVASRFSANNGWKSRARHLISHGLRRDLISPTAAARVLVDRLIAPEPGGKDEAHFFDRNGDRALPEFLDSNEQAGKLWNLSVQMTGLSDSISPEVWRNFRPSEPKGCNCAAGNTG